VAPVLAALLTYPGVIQSNDSIVVMDRVRENVSFAQKKEKLLENWLTGASIETLSAHR